MSASSSHIEPLPEESPLLWPALALLVLAVACFTYYWNDHRYEFPYITAHGPLVWPPPPGSSPEPPAGPVSASMAPVSPALGSFVSLQLPDDVSLHVPALGMESKLVAFIKDPSKPVDKNTWFEFDRLLFETNKATLEPSSQEQLSNIAAILKAYPSVHARIGGYTDNTGDAAANLQLSQQRATNVMDDLVKMGVSANRLDAKGYGSDHPVGDNTSEQGRAENRRIALRVTQK